MAKKPETEHRGVLHYLRVGVSVGVFSFVALIGVLAIVVPAVTGSTPYTVLTGSMGDSYPPGTLIIVKPIDARDIYVGDPITYQLESGKPAVVTHRVVSITSGSDGSISFTTQGDANNVVDGAPVIPEQVRGKVWYALPYLGYVNSALSGGARVWLIPLIAASLFLYAGYLVTGAVVTKTRKQRRKRAGEDGDGTNHEDVSAVASPQDPILDR